MNLLITWAAPTPIPSCGYTAYYRRKGDPSYLTATTSGATSVNIPITNPASYEGYVQSNCCGNNLSLQSPWGVNKWEPINIAISRNAIQNQYSALITSPYANPYATYLSGTFYNGVITVTFTSLLYPANSTTATVLFGTADIPVTISNIVVTSITPAFDNSGSLQRFDAVLTPPYFVFYDGSTSGVTWLGSPATLPSFTLDTFTITAQDQSGNTTVGNLLVSWVQDFLYAATSGGTLVFPNTLVIFQVKDPGNNIIGTLTTTPGLLGVNNASITLTLANASYPLTNSTQFVMICRRGNNTLISSNVFYLPI